MTERLRQLRLEAFRGVPGELLIDLGSGSSLVVYGDNGTGKSSVADAFEWYFTGEIELLAHEGRQHAVRSLGAAKDRPTVVELETTGSLGGRAVFPQSGNGSAREAASRETFLLRGRTLADFINKTKTEKWRALAEILGLDGVDRLRQDLQRVRTELRKRAKTAQEELQSCRAALAPSGEELDEESILSGLRQICRGLGMDEPDSLDRVREPSWQLAFLTQQRGQRPADQRQLIADEAAALECVELDAGRFRAWNELVDSPRLARLRFLDSARSALGVGGEPEACPLCSQPIEGKPLSERLRDELLEVEEAAEALVEARSRLEEHVGELDAAHESREGLRLRAGLLGIQLPALPASPESELLVSLEEETAAPEEIAATFLDSLADWDDAAKRTFAEAEEVTGNASEQQLDMLAKLCRQIDAWRSAETRAAEAARARDLADRLYAAYQECQQEHLRDILTRINDRVADLYERLHPGEGLDRVRVEPWTAKGVELSIEFHGSRQRPPHGVLSESHLNSLAIALFLAMAETFNEKLGFLVLDDVINSFDLEHRGSLANLLADKTDWQLIVLTHDYQFYEHITRRAPSWRRLELTSWTFDEGPRTTGYRSGDRLAEARVCLENGDTNGAATKTRRALEEQLQEVCAGLQALLPFRRGASNDRRQLGELFQGVRRALKEHAKPLLKALEAQLRELEADVGAALNVEAHAGPGRATAAEVEAAIARTEALDQTWTCGECGSRIWFKGTPEAARCRCGKSRFPPVASN